MPTYQYACSSCLHEFEVFQAFSDSSLTHCPECNGKLNKVYSAVGVVFKGSGFYKTDSKSESKLTGSKESSSSKEKTTKTTTTESTPTAKSSD